MKRSESSGGLSFDWPLAAKYAGIGLVVGSVLAVIGIFTWGGGPENFDNPLMGPFYIGVYGCVLGAMLALTKNWRADGGVKYWIAWVVGGGIAAVPVMGLSIFASSGGPEADSWMRMDLSSALIFWVAMGPFMGVWIGALCRSWGDE